MTAFDARRVEKAGVVADQASAGKHEPRQRLQTARGDRARAVCDALAAFEEGAYRRMRLVALEFLVGTEIGIRVAEPDHESDAGEVVFHVIEERAAVGIVGKRPAGGVHDEPFLVLLGPDFPELFQSDAVDLGIDAFAQAVAFLKLFAEIAAAAFGKYRVFACSSIPG